MSSDDDEASRQRMKAKAAEMLKLAEWTDDFNDTPSSGSTEKKFSRPMPKPVFLSPTDRLHSAGGAVDEDGETAEESRQIARSIVGAERSADHRSPEERRVAGTTFDINSVDDTDGLDEAEELEKWREREAIRIRWELAVGEKWAIERAEAKQRRSMTDPERAALDAQKQQERAAVDEAGSGSYGFLQKYYHKGAFYQEEALLHTRSYSEPTGADRGVAREALPAVLQVRDFGKKGRSKWTHLSGEDTTAFDYGWGDKKNPVNYQPVSKMGGMRDSLDNPSAKRRR